MGIFPFIQFMKVLLCCRKDPHTLSKIQDLKVYTLSFLQLSLELPETTWSLRKLLYIKKCPKKVCEGGKKGTWSPEGALYRKSRRILVNIGRFNRKSQRILINIDRFIQEKSKRFLPTSVNLYGKSQRILVNIGQFIWETSKDFSMHRSISTEKVNRFLPTSVDSNTKSETIESTLVDL